MRENILHLPEKLCLQFTAGRLATAVRFGSRPAPPAGRHLTGQKGLQDVPYGIAAGRC